MTNQLEGFEVLKELYVDDPDFKMIYPECKKGKCVDYHLLDEFLFKGTCLCISSCSMREYIIK